MMNTPSTSSSSAYSGPTDYTTGGQGMLRISGLASGIDVDSIVKKLMDAEAIPLNQMKGQQQLLEWQRDDYRTMNSTLLDFQSATFNMKLQGSFLARTTSSSNDSVVTAVSGTSAGSATYNLSNITMATAAYNSSTASIIAASASFDPDQSLASQASNLANMSWTTNAVTNETVDTSAGGTSFKLANNTIDTSVAPTITVGGTSVTTYTDQASYDAAVSASPGTQMALIDPTTGNITLSQSVSSGTNISANYTYKSIDFTITTTDQDGNQQNPSFHLAGSSSLNDVITAINSSSLGINAFYDTKTGKVSMTRTMTGDNQTGNEMAFSGSFLTSTLNLSGSETNGTDASFTLNGLTTSRHSNTFTINGTTFTLKGNSASTINITSQTDTDTVFNTIQDWVNKYNDTIKTINDKISEKRNRDYQPLTDAQKAQMSDSDLKLWTDKAQSGMLSNDTILPAGLSEMRQDLYAPVKGTSDSTMNQLAQIGITTSPNYFDNGKLVIDESKLKQAISDNPQAVMDMFTANGDTTDTQGIAVRMYNTLSNTMDKITQQAGNDGAVDTSFYLGKQISDYDTQISDFEKHLNDVQSRYYKQFTAMEQAIQQLNQQSTMLQGQFG